MTRISNPFRYSFINPHPSTSCIFKLWFGQKKFFIWKSKALHQSVNQFAIEIDRRMRLGLKGPTDIYKHIVGYIRKARVTEFRVEVILDSDNPVELLKEEYKLLQLYKKNEDCLNVHFDPMFPKWIPETAVKEFYDWKRDLQKQRKQKVTKKKKDATAKKSNKIVPARRSTGKKSSVHNRKRGGTGIRRKA